MKPEEFSEGKFTSINEKSGCKKKDEDAPEEVTLAKKFPIKETLEDISHQ